MRKRREVELNEKKGGMNKGKKEKEKRRESRNGAKEVRRANLFFFLLGSHKVSVREGRERCFIVGQQGHWMIGNGD